MERYNILTGILFALLVVILFMNIIMMFVMLPESPGAYAVLYAVYPWPDFIYPFINVVPPFSVIWYSFLMVIILVSFALFITPLLKKVVAVEDILPLDKMYRDFSLAFAIDMSVSIILMFIYYLLNTSVHAPSLDTTPLRTLALMLLNASVWEEVVCRLLYIGGPLVIYGVLTGKIKTKNVPRALLGGNFDVKDRFSQGVLTFSAFLFAFAHIAGWGPAKVPMVLVGGFVFGYLYMKYGLHVSILLHFLSDFIAIGPEYNNTLTVVYGIILTVAIIMAFIYTAAAAHRYLLPKHYEEEIHTYPVCRVCGSKEFIYDNGTFICTVCGGKNTAEFIEVKGKVKNA